MTDGFLSKAEVIKITRLSLSTILRLEKEGLFPSRIQIGKRRIAYTAKSINEWMNTREQVVTREEQPQSATLGDLMTKTYALKIDPASFCAGIDFCERVIRQELKNILNIKLGVTSIGAYAHDEDIKLLADTMLSEIKNRYMITMDLMDEKATDKHTS